MDNSMGPNRAPATVHGMWVSESAFLAIIIYSVASAMLFICTHPEVW